MSDNLHALQKRLAALAPSRSLTIPAGRVVLAWPVPSPCVEFAHGKPSRWTNDPARTAAAAWASVDHIWAQETIPPGMAGALERCVGDLETIAGWAREQGL